MASPEPIQPFGPNSKNNMYAKDEKFWQEYTKARPQVPQSFFDRIFAFHEQNGGKFDVVHDVGAGGGVHSSRLAQRFKKVVVSDPSESNIEVAKRLLQGPQYEFHVAKIEDPSVVPDQSVDMVFGAVMMHWVKLDEAIMSVKKQLKSDGSFIVSHYGFARYPSDPSVGKAWDQLYQAATTQLFRLSDKTESLPSTLQMALTGYDCLGLSDQIFKPGTVRLRINDDSTIVGGVSRQMYISPEIRQRFPHVSNTGEHDKISFEESEEWSANLDIDRLMAMLATYPADYDSEPLKSLLAKLREEMPPEKVVHGKYPVGLIMASKK